MTPKLITAMAVAFIGYVIFIPVHINISLSPEYAIDDRGTRGDEKNISVQFIKEGGVLKSGEKFRIRFSISQDAYVYLLSCDSAGEINNLFSDKIKAGDTLTLPNEKEQAFRLDHQTGTETICVLASTDPIDRFEQKLEELKKSGIQDIGKLFPDASVKFFKFRHE
jgi:hypothetical protein